MIDPKIRYGIQLSVLIVCAVCSGIGFHSVFIGIATFGLFMAIWTN